MSRSDDRDYNQGRKAIYRAGGYGDEICVTKHHGTGLQVVGDDGIYVPGDQQISAKALSLDGTPIANEGKLWVTVEKVVHHPHAHKAGVIDLVTPD